MLLHASLKKVITAGRILFHKCQSSPQVLCALEAMKALFLDKIPSVQSDLCLLQKKAASLSSETYARFKGTPQ